MAAKYFIKSIYLSIYLSIYVCKEPCSKASHASFWTSGKFISVQQIQLVLANKMSKGGTPRREINV
jgi:hypothetical protein